MLETLLFLKWPLLACLLLPWLLVFYGIHIVHRGVIFVDLALAQVAALGTAVALVAGIDPHDWQSFVISLGATFAGSALLSLTGMQKRVPQESLIGIIYVVAAAAGILVLSHSTAAKEELQRSLVGELLIVGPKEVLTAFGLFAVIGVAHFFLRSKFLALTFARENFKSAARWDFIFYALFGLVVTTFVHIGGVLLTFSFLIIPAVAGILLKNGFRHQLLAGWAIAIIGSLLSLLATAKYDLPIGATIVCVLALLLIGALCVAAFKPKPIESPLADHSAGKA